MKFMFNQKTSPIIMPIIKNAPVTKNTILLRLEPYNVYSVEFQYVSIYEK